MKEMDGQTEEQQKDGDSDFVNDVMSRKINIYDKFIWTTIVCPKCKLDRSIVCSKCDCRRYVPSLIPKRSQDGNEC